MTVIEQSHSIRATVYRSSDMWWWTIRVDGSVYASGEATTEADAAAKCRSALRAVHSHDE